MKRLQLDKDIKPLSEFRSNASALIEAIHQNKRPLIITQRGKSSAVILDVSEYEKLLDKIELLQDLQTAETQIKEGKGVSHKQALIKALATLTQ